jgi:hypothetical protein
VVNHHQLIGSGHDDRTQREWMSKRAAEGTDPIGSRVKKESAKAARSEDRASSGEANGGLRRRALIPSSGGPSAQLFDDRGHAAVPERARSPIMAERKPGGGKSLRGPGRVLSWRRERVGECVSA